MEFKLNLIDVILLIIAGLCIGQVLAHHSPYFKEVIIVSQDGFDLEFESHPNANGYVVYGKYFVVKTAGRSMNDIVRTTMHELAHVYDYRDPEHFCGRWME
jgi:hypothetical protein